MDDNELEFLIYRIISGYQNIKINNTLYKLVNPNIDLKIAANSLYHDYYKENKYNGFILQEDMDAFLISNNIIPSNFSENITKTEKLLDQAKIRYFKEFYTNRKTQNKNRIIGLNKAIQDGYAQKNSLNFLTLENFCENIKNEFIICNTLYDSNGNLFFNKPNTNIDFTLFNNIINKITNNMISIPTYKKIARSSFWKKIYSINKENVFSGACAEYTDEQKAIINISKMYDQIYEHPEAPDDKIIEDDDALDGWILDSQETNNRLKKQKAIDKNLSKASNASEVFIMTDKNQEQIDEVMSLNSPQALDIVKNRTSLAEGETKKDWDFADTQQSLREQLAKLNKRNK